MAPPPSLRAYRVGVFRSHAWTSEAGHSWASCGIPPGLRPSQHSPVTGSPSTVTVSRSPQWRSPTGWSAWGIRVIQRMSSRCHSSVDCLAVGGLFSNAGSAALALAYVAVGRLVGFFESDLRPWDALAGEILVNESGGRVTSFVRRRVANDRKAGASGEPGEAPLLWELGWGHPGGGQPPRTSIAGDPQHLTDDRWLVHRDPGSVDLELPCPVETYRAPSTATVILVGESRSSTKIRGGLPSAG